ncbi:ABC transporter ATP-binding protein [Roseateles sp. DAIF2]|uniref:ABC transporter ATP-binding protein n=1 Tax=Roseateles sp. DAIF2 TaxID=2714952 RepID=UPI0018A25207|nr:ABC transporter ATP-binding protein [Roseateles sp. DAIF2]QPF73996.1 ABC transporter ATP-binding protein [Roseateles sp. DAIF2]
MNSTRPKEEEPAIALRAVSKSYGPLQVVDRVDLDVARGELFALIGHNGAGKSTLFKMMLGLVPASHGEIRVAGCSVRARAFRAARRRVGYLPENLVLYDNLSGLETLRFFARLKGAPERCCQPLLERVGLARSLGRPVREYSKGMRQRLGFAQALLGDPEVLFLDEPSNGLDPAAIRDFYAILQELRQRGATVLITSHILAELQQRVDRLAILNSGRVQAQGSVDELRQRLDLPLTLRLRLAGDEVRGQLAAIVATLPGLSQGDADASGEALLRCPRPLKMAALTALQGLGARLLDLQIIEPSLEDLFFDLGRAA